MPPLSIHHFLSIPCSFWRKMAEIIGLPPTFWGIGAPLLELLDLSLQEQKDLPSRFKTTSRSKRECCCRSCRPFVHAVKLSILWWTLCQCLWVLCFFVRETLSHCHCHCLYSLVLTTKCYNIFTIPLSNHSIILETFEFKIQTFPKWNFNHISIHYGQSKWR